jgi:(p)ppGpp synthase/HD superfamily hydrolase
MEADDIGWESKFELCEYSSKLINLVVSLNMTVVKPVDILEIKKACYYAKEYHGDQKRKSGDPYYSHPIEVAYLFAQYVAQHASQYYTTTLIVVAILHDCLEDTQLTKDMMAIIFNQEVASKVEDLTRIKFNKKITAAESVNFLFLEHKNDILYIKLFDRLHNMRTISAMRPEKQKSIAEETIFHLIPAAMLLGANIVQEELVTLCTNIIKPGYSY